MAISLYFLIGIDDIIETSHFIAAKIEGDVGEPRILNGPNDVLTVSQHRRDLVQTHFDIRRMIWTT